MRFLTRSYVQWLGLERIPLALFRNRGYVSMGDGGSLPRAGGDVWDEGVIHEGVAYRREDDGLAYERVSDYLARRETPAYRFPEHIAKRYARQGIVLP